MSGRQGGKAKPLKAPKKEKKDLDDDDVAFKEKQKRDAAELKAMQQKAKEKGPLGGGGIKKYVISMSFTLHHQGFDVGTMSSS
ncbi:hypothetical protein ABW21_db0202441 [Orbilia brochopaga]|nr:hypothetical protein ABW21_db0202441 [Drechslerella brochopaga]